MNNLVSLAVEQILRIPSVHFNLSFLLVMSSDIADDENPPGSAALAFIVIAVMLTLTVLFPTIYFSLRQLQESKELTELLETGETAEARILEIRENGSMTDNNLPVVLSVEIIPQEKQSFRAEIKSSISILKIHLFQPGTIVKVKFNRENPQQATLVI